MLPLELLSKRLAVERLLRGIKRAIVAFSGGVDSTLLVRLCVDVLGAEHVLAATADSPSLARGDLQEASALAAALKWRHRVIPTGEVASPEYRENSANRCYFCKQSLFKALGGLAKQEKADAVLYGVLADDKLDERPGHRAAIEHGVRAPLQEAGLTKAEIRLLAKAMGLPNWNKPQNACLASRVPHGRSVTEGKLAQIERAEGFLHAQGFRQVRVRHFGTHARIEVGPEEIRRFNDGGLCRLVEEAFSEAGFQSVGIDRAGYRPGGAERYPADEILLSTIDRC